MKKEFVLIYGFILGMVLMSQGCRNNERSRTGGEINPANDPNFVIVNNIDSGFSTFNRKVVVFGIDIYAVKAVEDANLLHAANVMAQYLDNDEDGQVDDVEVHDQLLKNRTFMVMWDKESDLNLEPPSGRLGQDLGNDETNPKYVSGGKIGPFDASLEEILHIINYAGHSYAYPEAFGLKEDSELAIAMDVARGGKFLTLPESYPDNAWYSYDDETCDYSDCQTIEYLYWALTSLMGAQENRSDEIGHEWRLHTPALVEKTDSAIFQLLTNPKYKMPMVLPDGTYKR